MKNEVKQLVLNKSGEKYIYRYETGDEHKLLDALVEHASDKRVDFDWFDAAVLSFKLTQNLIGEADELIYNGSPGGTETFRAGSDKK